MKIMKATIWFTNMLQNILHIFKYKVVLNFFYSSNIYFKGFSRHEKIARLGTTCTTITQYHFLGHKKALTYKALKNVFRHSWVGFNHLHVNTESSRYNLTCARSFERHLL